MSYVEWLSSSNTLDSIFVSASVEEIPGFDASRFSFAATEFLISEISVVRFTTRVVASCVSGCAASACAAAIAAVTRATRSKRLLFSRNLFASMHSVCADVASARAFPSSRFQFCIFSVCVFCTSFA